MTRYLCTRHEQESDSPLPLKTLHLQLTALHQQRELEKRKELARRANRVRLRLQQRRRAVRQETRTRVAEQIMLALPKQEQQLRHDVERECLSLSLSIIRDFLTEVLPEHRYSLAQRIQRAMKEFQETTIAQLVLHPKDKEQILLYHSEILDEGVQIHSSDEVPRGKARLETSRGTLHIDWENDLERIARKLIVSHSEQHLAPISRGGTDVAATL